LWKKLDGTVSKSGESDLKPNAVGATFLPE
jgi:hypothetical protein